MVYPFIQSIRRLPHRAARRRLQHSICWHGEPTDITLLGDGGEGHTVLVISVTRYSIPETPTKPSEDNQVGLSTFEQGKYSDKDGDEEGEIDRLRAAMFSDQLPRQHHRVWMGVHYYG